MNDQCHILQGNAEHVSGGNSSLLVYIQISHIKHDLTTFSSIPSPLN